MTLWLRWLLATGRAGASALDRFGSSDRDRDSAELERLGGRINVVFGIAGIGLIAAGPIAGVILGGIAAVIMAMRDRSAWRRAAEELRRGFPEVVGLLGVAASAGLNPHRSIQVVSEIVDGPLAPLIAKAAALARAGYTGAESLMRVGDSTGLDEFRSLARAFAASERQGAPLAPALQRLGRDLAEQRRRRAEAAARKAPVRVLFPLVVCVLPAFVLLAVVPVFVDTLNVVRA